MVKCEPSLLRSRLPVESVVKFGLVYTREGPGASPYRRAAYAGILFHIIRYEGLEFRG